MSDTSATIRELYVFCDASKSAYGSEAYLQILNEKEKVHVSFVIAFSKVAPRKCVLMPRLELCAALSGAQMSKVIQTEVTIPIHQVTYWADLTTVLHWLRSESCQYKVFVGSRVAEIHMLTDVHITRGITLEKIAGPY